MVSRLLLSTDIVQKLGSAHFVQMPVGNSLIRNGSHGREIPRDVRTNGDEESSNSEDESSFCKVPTPPISLTNYVCTSNSHLVSG